MVSVPRERKRCPAARAHYSWSCLIDGAHPNPPGSLVDWGADKAHARTSSPGAACGIASPARTMPPPTPAPEEPPVPGSRRVQQVVLVDTRGGPVPCMVVPGGVRPIAVPPNTLQQMVAIRERRVEAHRRSGAPPPLAAPAQAEAAGDDSDPAAIYLSYLDKLRGETSTRPIWALSRGLVDEHSGSYEMARTFVALAATCRRARDLCTPGLRAYMVYGMARALARGGAFLKGKRAGTLVASLIKHTTHSPPERLGLVPLLICDETVEVLLPLLRCTDWIDFDDYGILEVFTNYPSFLYKDKHDGRLQVRDVAALLLCARSLRLPDDFRSRFDDDNCWDFSAGCGSADGRFSHVEHLTLEHVRALLDIVKDAGRPSARIVYEFLRYLSQSMMRKDSPEFSKVLFMPVALALSGIGMLGKWRPKKHATAEKALNALMKLGDDCVATALDSFAEGAIEIQKRLDKRRAARGGGAGDFSAAEDTAARQAAADQAAADLIAELDAADDQGKKARKKKPAPVPAPAPAPAAAEASSSSSSSSEDDDDDDLLLLAKQQASRSAPRARARTKAAPSAAPRARESPAMTFARALRGWIVSRGGRIVGTDLAQFYKSPAASGLSVPKGGALKLLRTVAAPAGLRISQDGPRIVISSVGAVATPPPPPTRRLPRQQQPRLQRPRRAAYRRRMRRLERTNQRGRGRWRSGGSGAARRRATPRTPKSAGVTSAGRSTGSQAPASARCATRRPSRRRRSTRWRTWTTPPTASSSGRRAQ